MEQKDKSNKKKNEAHTLSRPLFPRPSIGLNWRLVGNIISKRATVIIAANEDLDVNLEQPMEKDSTIFTSPVTRRYWWLGVGIHGAWAYAVICGRTEFGQRQRTGLIAVFPSSTSAICLATSGRRA